MSGMGSQRESPFLPEDVEEELRKVQNTVVDLNLKKTSLENEVASKDAQLVEINLKIHEANILLDDVTSRCREVEKSIATKEIAFSQKEEIFKITLKETEEREQRVNRYLAVFENMRNFIGEDNQK